MIFTIKKSVAEVKINTPRPKIEAVDKTNKPRILAKQETATVFISVLIPFTIANITAGPGLNTYKNAITEYIKKVSIFMFFPFI
jgi:hypothetical protein